MVYIPVAVSIEPILGDIGGCFLCENLITLADGMSYIAISPTNWEDKEMALHPECFDSLAANVSYFWIKILNKGIVTDEQRH